jgi:hypothetical protein
MSHPMVRRIDQRLRSGPVSDADRASERSEHPSSPEFREFVGRADRRPAPTGTGSPFRISATRRSRRPTVPFHRPSDERSV